MADKIKPRDWAPIVNSVKTPLGFFTLVALVVDAGMGVAATVTGKVPLWAPVGLLGALVACVFVLVLFKPLALYHPSDWPLKPITVNVRFPVEPVEVDLDITRCVVEVRDRVGRSKHKGVPNLVFGHGGWVFQVAENVEPSDSVRLELVEASGRKWSVRPFPPYETKVEAARHA